jgi:hypothetical protein
MKKAAIVLNSINCDEWTTDLSNELYLMRMGTHHAAHIRNLVTKSINFNTQLLLLLLKITTEQANVYQVQ